MAMEQVSNILSGISGEYLVAGELSRLGYVATITLRNTRGIDILASNLDASRAVGIQVKTAQGNDRRWLLRKSAETYFDDNLFYVFVNLNKGSAPSFHVVPSEVVARRICEDHRAWLQMPGRRGRLHRDNPMRMFKDAKGEFLDRWDLLGLSPSRAP